MRKAIAIDFDGCLCSNAYPAIGEPNWDVIERAKKEQSSGAGLILWTCREGQPLEDAVNACKRWGLIFDAVNESLSDWIEAFGNHPRKVGASEYWDDKAVCMPEKFHDLPSPSEYPQECPLTPDELKEMVGLPVYIKWSAAEGFYALISRLAVGGLYYVEELGRIEYAPFAFYGDSWFAYRQKP
ncbi:hypothetical protein [Bacteroides acidifaciens]|uniref:hypothetical protein n=1 Tax=Bacteroides acidifaciens TaxID=85831 RepID=UPI00248C2304|nr:hypothetical protein [Bacteroides acidifaciens]